MRKYFFALIFLAFAFSTARGQDYLYATGSPVYSTTLPIDGGFVNVNNGEIHLEIPLATYKQRGNLVLDEKLVYDSRIWKIAQSGSSYSWQPSNVANAVGGWSFYSGGGAGSVRYATNAGTDSVSADCPAAGSAYPAPYSQYYNWYWTDPAGTSHAFPSVSTVYYDPVSQECPLPGTGNPYPAIASSSGTANDGSGYTLTVSNYFMPVVTSQNGINYYPTNAEVNAPVTNTTDRHGNYWSTDSKGNLIGTNGLAPILTTSSGNQTVYSVLGVNGARNNYTVTTTTVSFNTQFAETAVSEASGSFTAIQSIKLPDGSSYQFSYDSGTTAGHYGELTSMTLPTGGVVNYGWSNYVDSFNNTNRWLSGITRDGGTTVFTPALISKCSSSAGCQESVSVQKPDGNTTLYTFNLDKTGEAAGSSWVQGIKSYQGSATSGTLLRSTTTNYTYLSGFMVLDQNGTLMVDGAYEVPASIVNTVTLNDVGLTSQTTTTLDGTGSLPTDVKVWDFGVSPSGSPSQEIVTTYASWAQPSSVTVKDSKGNTLSKVTYGFDETQPAALPAGSQVPNYQALTTAPSNQTSMHQWINTTGATLDTFMTYDVTGALLSSTTPEGKTTYLYDSSDTYVSSATLPTPSSGVTLSSSTTYDANTGLPLTSVDPNNQTTTYKSYSALLQPLEVDFPDGGKSIYSWSPNQQSVRRYLNGNTYGETAIHLDGYGRADREAVYNGQNGNNYSHDWYQQDVCFDANGRLQFRGYTYQSSGLGAGKVCSGSGDTYSYDALGRVLSVAHADGTSLSYTYNGRATQVKDENGVTRITQLDGLGRIASVCEVSAVTLKVGSSTDATPVACSQDISATGFLTTYGYTTDSSKDQVTTVTQGAQTRTTVTDSLGRTISVKEPERGTTTYSYAYSTTAGLGLTVTRQRPQANQTNASVSTTTTTQYDSLGRMVSASYNDSLTPTKLYYYDTGNWAEAGSQQYLKGRLSLATTGNTGTLYSYDSMGRANNTWQCTPSGCGNASDDVAMSFAYDWVGNLLTQTSPGTGTIAYGRSPAGEVTSVINQTWTLSGTSGTATLLSNAQNGPNGPISYNFGNGLSQFNSYDSLGRLNGGWVCVGAPSAACSNPNVAQRNGFYVTWSGSRATGSGEDYVGQGMTYQYDDFNRLVGTKNSAGTATFSYVYDRYGNRWQQNALQGGPSFSQSFNAVTSNNQLSSGGYTYDAAGNMTYDASGGHHFTYDAEGNILQVDAGQSDSWTFILDALNRRVSARTSGLLSECIFDLNGTCISGNTASSESHIYADGVPLAYRSGDGKTYFIHQNWLNTDRVHTDQNGATGATYTSLPFGDGGSANVSENYAGWDFQHFGGIGVDYWDSTYSAQFRNYSELQARWLSPDPYDGSYDPSNPQSFNRYAYVLNNPLSFTDPLGLATRGDGGAGECDWCDAFGQLIVDGFESLFDLFGHSSFHGSLTPRPTTGSFGDGSFDQYGVFHPDNPYTIQVNSWLVPGSSYLPLGSININISSLIPSDGLRQRLPEMRAYHPPTPLDLSYDPACLGAPDAVSDIHNLQRGNPQGSPLASTDGQFGTSMWQRTTQGDRSFGNAAADMGFNAGFMGADYVLAVTSCLQGH